MEKLIELLNEYDSGWDYDDYYGPYQYGQDRDAYKYGKYYLLSRDYGFIKWLVDNDKIDLDKVEEKSDLIEYLIGTPTKVYENIIMILAIQDEPIRFLCEIIK